MKKTLRKTFTLGILIIGFSVFGQEFGFDIHNTSLAEYIQMEENLGSERIPTTSNHVSFSGDAQPIKYQRKEKVIPDLITYLTFKESDSTMSKVLYEWDVRHFSENDEFGAKQPKKVQKGLYKKFIELEKKLIDLYGAPETDDVSFDVKKALKEGLNKNNKWFPNDSTEIVLYTAISNRYEKKGMVTITPTYRIRLYVRNTTKDKKIDPKLDEKTIDTLNTISIAFLKSLSNNDFPNSKEYLSDKILETVTDEQLNALIQAIDFDREMELFFSGLQFGLDGSSFKMLQYKYGDDNSKPPKELIKIIYDEGNKIIGIQPVKLNGKMGE